MDYNQLGRTGLQISTLGLGVMNFGSRVDKETAHRILNKAYDLGFNFIDTANTYGKSEQILGEWFESSGNRDDMIISTKVGWPTGQGVNDKGLSRKHVIKSVHKSLNILQTDYIDIYQPHSYDGDLDLEPIVAMFSGLVDSNLVRVIGAPLFTYPIYAQKWYYLAKRGNYHNIQTKLMTTSLLSRGMEKGNTIALAKDIGLGLITFGTLGGGLLTGKYRQNKDYPEDGKEMFKEVTEKGKVEPVLDVMEEISSYHDITLAQLALLWVLERNFMDCVILGASKPDQLEGMIEVIDISLNDDEIKQLTEISDQHHIW